MRIEADFTAALFDPGLMPPTDLVDPCGRPAGKRFDIYRNNVVVSLTEALEAAFPVVRKLVGEANFKVLAGAFLRAHPPRSPLLMLWGDELAGFLTDFAPVQSIGYLPDVARLEQAIRESYHAADADPIDPALLGQLSPQDLTAARLHLAPALRIVPSRWPIHAIWRFNMDEGAPKPVMAREDVLITRPGFDPELAVLPEAATAFLTALKQGQTLGEALSAPGIDDGFDLNTTLGLLLSGGAITKIGDIP
ncbi:MAG: DNA-binding domain-containing protein [Pseudomonadota bacterium]